MTQQTKTPPSPSTLRGGVTRREFGQTTGAAAAATAVAGPSAATAVLQEAIPAAIETLPMGMNWAWFMTGLFDACDFKLNWASSLLANIEMVPNTRWQYVVGNPSQALAEFTPQIAEGNFGGITCFISDLLYMSRKRRGLMQVGHQSVCRAAGDTRTRIAHEVRQLADRLLWVPEGKGKGSFHVKLREGESLNPAGDVAKRLTRLHCPNADELLQRRTASYAAWSLNEMAHVSAMNREGQTDSPPRRHEQNIMTRNLLSFYRQRLVEHGLSGEVLRNRLKELHNHIRDAIAQGESRAEREIEDYKKAEHEPDRAMDDTMNPRRRELLMALFGKDSPLPKHLRPLAGGDGGKGR